MAGEPVDRNPLSAIGNQITVNRSPTAGMPSPRFVRGLQAYLSHWLAKTAELDDTAIGRLNPDFPGLLKPVQLGLVLPETQVKTTELILQCFFWVEQVGYIQVWQPLVELAVQRISPTHSTLHFRLLKQLGQLQRLQYQLDAAVATFQQAEQLAHSLTNGQVMAEIYMNLCQVYHLKNAYEEAGEYGRLALTHLAENQPKFKAITLRTMGIMAQEQGSLQQAEEYLKASLKFAISPKEQALTLNVLAVTFQQWERYDQALETYDEVLTLLDSMTNTTLFVEVQLNKGSLLYSLRHLDEAEVVFKRADELLRQLPGLFYYKALTANNLGCIWRERKQFMSAETSFRRSIQQFAQVGAQIYEANAWGNLAKLHSHQERRTKAIACYDEAIRLVSAYPDNAFARKLQTNYTTLRNELQWPGRNNTQPGHL